MITRERVKITKLPLFIISLKAMFIRLIRGKPTNILDVNLSYINHIEKRTETVKLHFTKRHEKTLNELNLKSYSLNESLNALEKSSSPHSALRKSIIERELNCNRGKIKSINELIAASNERVNTACHEIVSAYLSGYFFGLIPNEVLEVINHEE